MRAIYIYVECTKVITNNWDIRPSVTIKALFANISWMTGQIHTIKIALESTYQSNMAYFKAISISRDTSISI